MRIGDPNEHQLRSLGLVGMRYLLMEDQYMSSRDRIEDIEQRIFMAYQEGNYQEAKALEAKIKKLRGKSTINQYDERDPYSMEGKVFDDDDSSQS